MPTNNKQIRYYPTKYKLGIIFHSHTKKKTNFIKVVLRRDYKFIFHLETARQFCYSYNKKPQKKKLTKEEHAEVFLYSLRLLLYTGIWFKIYRNYSQLCSLV